MRRRVLMGAMVILVAAVAGAVVGTVGAAGATPVDPLGYVRVLHGDPAMAGRPVDVAVDGVVAGRASWAAASPWLTVAPGPHRVTATGGTDVSVEVGAGCGVTVVTGRAGVVNQSTRVVVIPDCAPARLAPGQARITAVVVTDPSFGAVVVEVNGGRRRVEPHNLVGGTVVPAGDVHVRVSHPDTGVVYLQRHLHLDEGAATTVALVGGGEVGATLAAVDDAGQARTVPHPGQPIHTGVGDRSLWLALGVAAGAGLLVLAARRVGRGAASMAFVFVAAGMVFTGCSPEPCCSPDGAGVAATPTVVAPAPPAGPPRVPSASPAPPTISAPPGVSVRPETAPLASLVTAGPPAVLRVDELGLDLPVGRLDDVAGLPRSLPLREVAWLTGTSPAGVPGTTAIVGHTGRGPFGRLGVVRPGDAISVTDASGHAHTYTTVSVSVHRKNLFPREVWDPQRLPTLVLITCTGERDPQTGLHLDNLVVRAVAA